MSDRNPGRLPAEMGFDPTLGLTQTQSLIAAPGLSRFDHSTNPPSELRPPPQLWSFLGKQAFTQCWFSLGVRTVLLGGKEQGMSAERGREALRKMNTGVACSCRARVGLWWKKFLHRFLSSTPAIWSAFSVALWFSSMGIRLPPCRTFTRGQDAVFPG